jgi:hypothetical protein
MVRRTASIDTARELRNPPSGDRPLLQLDPIGSCARGGLLAKPESTLGSAQPPGPKVDPKSTASIMAPLRAYAAR